MRLFRRRVNFEELSDEDFVVGAYQFLYGIEPDPGGFRNYVDHLRAGTRTRASMLAEMRGLDDWWLQRVTEPLLSIHLSRKLWIQALPKADRILDLGGTDQGSSQGALVRMGYPYRFERLAIVDLPPEGRHELYAASHGSGVVETPLGPVEHHEGSMTDLSRFGDATFDLVVSGQSIEHVSEADGDVVLAEVRRVLRPGGSFCLDTPNGAACQLQLGGPGVTNPDHEIEYTHAELSAKLERAGFEIEVACGLNYLPQAFATGVFTHEELARHVGVFADIEHCYVLAYRCRRP